jgi:2-amino-4-hydroxy-6-hydroxymethyldihydropteridine diphosphokinase
MQSDLRFPQNMRAAYLGLGANLGDRAANLLMAVGALCGAGLRLSAMSSIYETEPVDYLDQPDFLNMALAVVPPHDEDFDPFRLLRLCLEVETRLGRERSIPKGARVIDIDLLLVDGMVVDEVRDGVALTLPHPRLHFRRFALAPLAEIAPDMKHPVFGQSMARLLDLTPDASAVNLYRA